MNRRIPEHHPRKTLLACGYSPCGCPVYAVGELPELARFEHVVLGAHSIIIDGWELPYRRLNKSLLRWIHRSVIAWHAAHPGEAEWMDAILDTFQQRLAGEC